MKNLPDQHESNPKKVIIILTILTLSQLLFTNFIADAGELTTVSLIECTNKVRRQYGAENLHLNSRLNEAAQTKLDDMDIYDYWAHTNPFNGKNPWDFVDEAGYYYREMGENLAIGYMDSNEICDAWRKSELHLKNLINPNYQEVGIAINKTNLHKNGKGILVVQMFGSRDDFDHNNKDHIPPETTNINSDITEFPEQGVTTPQSGGLVKAESRKRTNNDNYLDNIGKWIINNTIFFIIFLGYLFLRSVTLHKRLPKSKIKTHRLILYSSILAIASISLIFISIMQF